MRGYKVHLNEIYEEASNEGYIDSRAVKLPVDDESGNTQTIELIFTVKGNMIKYSSSTGDDVVYVEELGKGNVVDTPEEFIYRVMEKAEEWNYV